jgi:hypothetical protein
MEKLQLLKRCVHYTLYITPHLSQSKTVPTLQFRFGNLLVNFATFEKAMKVDRVKLIPEHHLNLLCVHSQDIEEKLTFQKSMGIKTWCICIVTL